MKWIKYSIHFEYCNQESPKYSRMSKNKYNIRRANIISIHHTQRVTYSLLYLQYWFINEKIFCSNHVLAFSHYISTLLPDQWNKKFYGIITVFCAIIRRHLPCLEKKPCEYVIKDVYLYINNDFDVMTSHSFINNKK